MRSCPASSVTDTSPYGKVLEWSRRTQWCGSLSQVSDDTWRSAFSSLCPLGSRRPLRHAVTSAPTGKLTRRIDSSPASVCAPTVSAGRCALGFRLEITDDTWRSTFSSLCPLGCRGPLRPVLRTQHTLRSLLPRARIPLANSRSDLAPTGS
jgi:hypothetical protein